MVVPANSPIKTAKDLAEAVKKDVAKVTFAGGSAGGVDHIMAALFVGAAGADAVEGQLRAVLRRRRVARRDPRRQGHGRHFRLWRIRGPDQGRQAARHRRDLAASACPASTCRPSRSRASISCSPTGARCSARPASRDAQKKALGDAGREAGRSRRPGRTSSSRRAGTTPTWRATRSPIPGGRADPRRRRDEDGGLGEVSRQSTSTAARRAARQSRAACRTAGAPRAAWHHAGTRRTDTAGMVIAGALLLIAAGDLLGHAARCSSPRPTASARRPCPMSSPPGMAAARRRQFLAGLARRFPERESLDPKADRPHPRRPRRADRHHRPRRRLHPGDRHPVRRDRHRLRPPRHPSSTSPSASCSPSRCSCCSTSC